MFNQWRKWVCYFAAKLMYCPSCKREMPFEKSVWDGAWVCQKCGYRMK